LDDVVDLGLNEVKEDFNAAVGGPLDLDGADSNGAHRLANKVNINFGGVATKKEEKKKRSFSTKARRCRNGKWRTL